MVFNRFDHGKPSKARIAFACLKRLSYWPDLWRRVKINIGQSLLPDPMGRDRNVAESWASEVAVDESELFSRLHLNEGPPLAAIHPNYIASAQTAERKNAERLGCGWGASADLIFRLCESVEARTAVETGVAYGWSSLAILVSIIPRGGWLYSVDMPHPLLHDEDLTGCVVPDALHANWTLRREPDSIGVRKILSNISQIDLIHYDSDKSYEGRAATYRTLWPYLRSGGLLISDDVGDNTAFRDFAAEAGTAALVVSAVGSGHSGMRYVGVLQKP